MLVAQVYNLQYSGFTIRKRHNVRTRGADWKSATQQVGNLRYVTVLLSIHT